MRRLLLTAAACAATALLATSADAQTIGCTTGGPGGLIPTSGTGGSGAVFPTTLPAFGTALPLNVSSVPAGSTCVTEVKLIGLAHTYASDVQVVLEAPGGAKYNLWCRAGGFCDFSGGNYSVIPAAGSVIPPCSGTIVPPGAYDPEFGTWPSGTNGIVNVDLRMIPSAVGTWTLRFYDWSGADSGSIASWDLCFGTPPAPVAPQSPAVLTAPLNGASLYGPTVNLTWNAVPLATSYDIDVDGTITTGVTSPFGFASTGGLHTWTVRGTNTVGPGPWATPFMFTDLGLNAVLTTPANGASVLGPTVNLGWMVIPTATSYEIDVDGTLYSSNTNSFAFSSTPGMHTWTVRGVNASGVGTFAAPFTFTDVGTASVPCAGPSLTTLFATNNQGVAGGQVFFDLTVIKPSGIMLAQIDTNTPAGVGTAFGMDVYTISGTYSGNENNMAAWTLIASGTGLAAGTNVPSVVEFPDVMIPAGSYGVSLVLSGVAHCYTNGTSVNMNHSNADLALTLGGALNTPWTGTPFTPRVWNGRLRYDCGAATPVPFCTAGTSTNGCVPTISGSAQPSVSLATACMLNVTGLEGQKAGLFFYGIDNTGFVPLNWGAGGTTYLCVKAPTQRMITHNSGGTINTCNGALSQDWNAFQTAYPTAVGNPFMTGQKVYVQAWFRDPPAVKTTNLSGGLEMTMLP